MFFKSHSYCGLLSYVPAKCLLHCKVLPQSHNARQHLATRQVRAALGTHRCQGVLSFCTAQFLKGAKGVGRCLGDPGAWSWTEILSQGRARGGNCVLNWAGVAARRAHTWSGIYQTWALTSSSGTSCDFNRQFNQTGLNFLQFSPARNVWYHRKRALQLLYSP